MAEFGAAPDGPELLGVTDEFIDDAVKYADPIILRGLLYQLTGDESVASVPQDSISLGFRGHAPAIVEPGDVAFLQAKAAAFLKAHRDRGGGDCPIGPLERLPRSLALAAGAPVPEAELPMWIEQLALDPMVRGYEWPRRPANEQREGFSVAVIGAGMGGLNAAVHLKNAGIPFFVLEKNGAVGGTWHENRYPGARLDTLSRVYYHCFGVDFPCASPFQLQKDNEAYFNWVADRFDLRGDIAFNTEVDAIRWDDDAQMWELTARSPRGPRTWRANAVISSVGFLSRPNIPALPGAESFRGKIVHTARWPEGLDLADKRVAVIGAGATSYQMSPVLAEQSGHVTLFQREPSWCFEVPGYLSAYPPQVPWLDSHFPYLANFTRFQRSWLVGPEPSLKLVDIDPDHSDPHTVSAINQGIREQCLEFLGRKFLDRPDLLEKMLPNAPPMTSRPVLVDSDNNIYDALLRENVELVTEPIDQVTPAGVRTADGRDYPVDIIVLATGYKAHDFLWPMKISGRGGAEIGQLWERDGARAYIGTMMPNFPNFFMLYGPNFNPFSNGFGLVEAEEFSTRFALKCIGELILQGRRTVDVTREAFDRFNMELDRQEATKVYADSRVTSYYQNQHGRSPCNCPFDVRQLWTWLLDPTAPQSTVETEAAVRPYLGEDLILG